MVVKKVFHTEMDTETGADHKRFFLLATHMSQLRAGGPVIPGLTSSGQSQIRPEHAPGCYSNPVPLW